MRVVKNIFNKTSIILVTLIAFICIVILFDSIKNPDEVPSFFGWKQFIITEKSVDEIRIGDIILVKEIDVSNLKKDDIIAYKDKNDIVTVCKISSINDEMINVKNNLIKDEISINKNQVEGIYKYRIAIIGTIALIIQTPLAAVLCLLIPIIVIIISSLIDYNNKQKGIERLIKKNAELEQKIK